MDERPPVSLVVGPKLASPCCVVTVRVTAQWTVAALWALAGVPI